MHHGFYSPDVQTSTSDLRSAQIRMVEECLRFAGVPGNLCHQFLTLFISVSIAFLNRQIGNAISSFESE
uniref:Uncharacterized protein n=1 Tax=Nelumbo nucifera TaxID=4432 RepID=A0A822YYS2_NELNU|nr:TPA_asm: hypothetical protein HUJ06_008463 [Nelumbo nucifera]